MYAIALGLLIMVSPGLARPAQDQPTSDLQNQNGPVTGFPASLLPSIPLTSLNGTTGLTSPLDPSQHTDIRVTIGGTYHGINVRGIELIASIATRLIDEWKDTANLPIEDFTSDERRLPFRDFEFSVRPTKSLDPEEVSSLTPLKLGIVYCDLIRFTLNRYTRKIPDHFGATIKESRKDIGVVVIKDSPLNNSSTPARSDNSANFIDLAQPPKISTTLDGIRNDTGSPANLISPPDVEHRWQQCWSTLLFWSLTANTTDLVVDRKNPPESHPAPSRKTEIIIPCWDGTGKYHDGVQLEVLTRPLPDSSHQLVTFGELVPSLLGWITKVAQTSDAWRLPAYIRDDAKLMVKYDSSNGELRS